MLESVIVPFPQDLLTFRQQESGTVFPPGDKYLQSEELVTPQHFIWKVKQKAFNTAVQAKTTVAWKEK